MDPTTAGRPEPDDVRVARIKLDIELAKGRIVDTIDALEYKADVPARIGDALSSTASTLTGRVLQAFTTARSTTADGTVDAPADEAPPS